MQEAFRPRCPLWRDELNPGESVALMDLLKAPLAYSRTPSHRRVDLSDPTEAAEIVLLADLLLRLLDKIDEPPSDKQDTCQTKADQRRSRRAAWSRSRPVESCD